MDNSKNIQVPMTMIQFRDIYGYMIDHSDEEFAASPEMQTLRKVLDAKMEKIIDHDLYTRYKTSPTDDQKEQARQEYLDRKGVPQSFRY